jgi:hypothetical protein
VELKKKKMEEEEKGDRLGRQPKEKVNFWSLEKKLGF